MITVAILINGNPIMARSAVNTQKVTADGAHIYHLDTGEDIVHHRDDGALVLAHKMLDTIKLHPVAIPAWAQIHCSTPT